MSDEEPCKGRTLVSVIIFFQSSWIDMHSGGVVMNCSEEQARAGKGEQQADCKKRCLRCEGGKEALSGDWMGLEADTTEQ